MLKGRSLFWVDIALFTALLATILTVSTDIFIHSFIHVFLGISLCTVVLLHVSLHWNWIKNTSQRHDLLPEPARSNAQLNIGLFCAYLLCGGIGLSARAMLFPFHLHVFLGVIHGFMAAMVVIFQAIHISRHRKWIKAMARKMVGV